MGRRTFADVERELRERLMDAERDTSPARWPGWTWTLVRFAWRVQEAVDFFHASEHLCPAPDHAGQPSSNCHRRWTIQKRRSDRIREILERGTGFEPATSSLGRYERASGDRRFSVVRLARRKQQRCEWLVHAGVSARAALRRWASRTAPSSATTAIESTATDARRLPRRERRSEVTCARGDRQFAERLFFGAVGSREIDHVPLLLRWGFGAERGSGVICA